ncbi:MAG: hypothetical protein AB2693_28015, partial [Candidatus Thiodiazotropha sp.]
PPHEVMQIFRRPGANCAHECKLLSPMYNLILDFDKDSSFLYDPAKCQKKLYIVILSNLRPELFSCMVGQSINIFAFYDTH